MIKNLTQSTGWRLMLRKRSMTLWGKLVKGFVIGNFGTTMRIMRARTGGVRAGKSWVRCGIWRGMICRWQLILWLNCTRGRRLICMPVLISCVRKITWQGIWWGCLSVIRMIIISFLKLGCYPMRALISGIIGSRISTIAKRKKLHISWSQMVFRKVVGFSYHDQLIKFLRWPWTSWIMQMECRSSLWLQLMTGAVT